MTQLLSTLTSETLQIVTFFCAGMAIAGIIVSIWGVWTRQIGATWDDVASLSSAWVVVMASGVAAVFTGVATGLLGTGIAGAIAYAIDRAASGTSKPFVSSGDFAWGSFLLLLGMIALAVAIFAAIAGVVQWSILRQVIDRPVSRWVKGNVQGWTVGIVVTLFVAVIMGQLVGLWGFNGVLLLGGLYTGGCVGEKVTSACLEKIQQERYERSQRAEEEVPEAPKVVPLIASALLVIASPLIVLALASLDSATPPERTVTSRGRVERTVAQAPTVEPTPTATTMPAIPAATFCTGIEQTHPSDTYVCVGSERGDPVGAGGNWVMTAESSDFNPISANSREVILSIQEGSNEWRLHFAAPVDNVLTPGVYDNALSTSGRDIATLSDSAILEVSSSPAWPRPSCAGRFEVLVFDHSEADWALGSVSVNRFAADFEQQCDSSRATLYGKIRINIPADDSE